ncbi:MAG: hypothetical protein BEN18_01560 [Epulopiscium sp. Nuni2H_MBin001]|nr:MAG: hypothetical protein BEN18_01560 [Epulopiscium sp. Nuni2H_MBin001]
MKDLVIVGGRYIVNIQYDKGVAPMVISRGMGNMGNKIREIAGADIRIHEDEALAHALFCCVAPGKKLPVSLYRLVEDILI